MDLSSASSYSDDSRLTQPSPLTIIVSDMTSVMKCKYHLTYGQQSVSTGKRMNGSAWASNGSQPRIAIIGAGMSGIAAVILLRKAGYTDLTVYEKEAEIGGTWRDNRYPGLSCDVPSYWYSYSFAPNSDWSHRFSYGPEIHAYLKRVVADFDVTSAIRFNSPVTSLTYHGPHWELITTGGQSEIYDFVIAATGILHHPAYPDIPGLDDFAGNMFHSARWDDSVPLEDKKVGIIGTGSTAAQIVGEVTPRVAHMTVFQRTPHWIVPMPQKTYSKPWKAFLHLFPFVHKILASSYRRVMLSTFAKATVGDKKGQEQLTNACRKHLESAVEDEALRAKLTPDYQAACKRLILCSDYYPAISSDKADLITDAIHSIESKGVRTVDGQLHELDVLVLATGFRAGDFLLPTKVTGEAGVDLETLWDGSPRAHRAMTVPGFPNLWLLEGPTGPVGNLSLIDITERQIDYMIQCLNKMKQDGLAAIAVKAEAFDNYNQAIDEAIKDTVWYTGGCESWYIDKSGRPNLYPWHPSLFFQEMKRPEFSEYRLMTTVAPESDNPAQAA